LQWEAATAGHGKGRTMRLQCCKFGSYGYHNYTVW